MKSIEGLFSREITSSKKAQRLLLSALAALAVNALVVRNAEAVPMVDGPAVCKVAGSKRPSIINPDPLSKCLLGETERLAAGEETIDYLNQYYPDGSQAPSFAAIVNGSLATASSWLAEVINEASRFPRK